MKLRASALYYALIFSVLIAILTSFLILFTYYSRNELNQYVSKQKLIQNCNSGLEYLKSESLEYLELKTDLFGKNKDSVLLIKKHWGLYDIYSSTAFVGSKKVTKSAIIGTSNSKYKNIALYLPNSSKALSISGNTRIVGNVYLSKAGIKRTNIEGQNYRGKELIYGKKYLSKNKLPKLNIYKQEYLSKALQNYDFFDTQQENIEKLYSENVILNSFFDKTKIFKSNTNIILSNIFIKGNIVIFSKSKIIVNSSTILNNIILIAPSIIIKENTKANVQLIAKDKILIEENVVLKYPSSMAIKTNKTASISIQNNSEINGDILLKGKNKTHKSSIINIFKNVTINGSVFCNGLISHKGIVNGSMFCTKFYLKTPSALYENHLINSVINNTNKNKFYGSGFIFEEKTEKNIVSWL